MNDVAQLLAQAGPLIADPTYSAHAGTNVELVLGILLFVLAGFSIVFIGLTAGKFLRPIQPHPEKSTPYECGEPAIGASWVQFDLRFYTVALVFIVFDVEIALLWPWAVVFKSMGAPAFWAFLVFFLLIAIPFLYEWKAGYLNWVRASTAQRRAPAVEQMKSLAPETDKSGNGRAATEVSPGPYAPHEAVAH